MHLCFFADAQPGTTIDLKKPDKYESRTLASEKTTESKIKATKKFYQNTITHYNYYFNASNRLDEIIERANRVLKMIIQSCFLTMVTILTLLQQTLTSTV
jgi:endonuclease IV